MSSNGGVGMAGSLLGECGTEGILQGWGGVGADAWNHAVRGRFYRPLKEAVSLRLDADVLAWLKKDGAGYQTRMNRILREQMLKDLEGR